MAESRGDKMNPLDFEIGLDAERIFGLQGLSLPWMEFGGRIYPTILEDRFYQEFLNGFPEEYEEAKEESDLLLKSFGPVEYLSYVRYGENPQVCSHSFGEKPVRPFTIESVKQPTPPEWKLLELSEVF